MTQLADRDAAGILPGAAPAAPVPSDRWLACAGLFTLGLWFRVGSGVSSSATVGDVLVILLVPLWWGSVSRYRFGPTVRLLGALAVGAGVALSRYAVVDHRVSQGLLAHAVLLLAGTLGGAGFVLWTRDRLSVAQIGFWYGSGLVVGIAVKGYLSFTTIGWKSGLAVAAAVLLLSIAARTRHPDRASLVVLAVLAVVSVHLDSRSYAATFALSMVLVVWRMAAPRGGRGDRHWAWAAALLGVLGAGIYYLGSTLLVDGYLGAQAQARSVAQIDAAGSLILGGRPEMGATFALFQERPMGFGAGVLANGHDITLAKQGMAALRYNPDNGYVNHFMFGGQIELHSTTGDLWARYGLIGLGLAGFVAFLVIRALALAVSTRGTEPLAIFLCWWTAWNLLFSPFLSAAPALLLALGLVLERRHGAEASA